MTTFTEYFSIMEMLDARCTELTWKHDGQQLNSYGLIDNLRLKITLDPITYHDHNGINLTFGIYDGIRYVETFQDQNTKNSAKIIGCVTNAMKDQLSNHDWDFILITSKDQIESRHKLYVKISHRFVRELGLSEVEFEHAGAKILILSKLSSDELTKIKQTIISQPAHR